MSVLNFSLLRIFQGYLVICCLIINVLCFCCLTTAILDYHISFRLSTTFLFFWDSFFCHSFLSVRTSVVFAASLSDECYSIMPLSNCQYFLYFLFYLYNSYNFRNCFWRFSVIFHCFLYLLSSLIDTKHYRGHTVKADNIVLLLLLLMINEYIC